MSIADFQLRGSRWLFLVLIFLSAASAHASDEYQFLATGKIILPSADGAKLLKQCSRPSPRADSFWDPSPAEIEQLETLLPAYLESLDKAGKKLPPKYSYHRQYIGFTREGKKLIYGNFFTADIDGNSKGDAVGAYPVIICDGGSFEWGVVYDPESHSFLEIAFNGLG